MTAIAARGGADPRPLSSMRAEHWRGQSACRGDDPEKWFPAKSAAIHADPAVRICRGCPVRAQCLRHALDFGEDYGVWGGLTERELRALRKRVS